MEQPRPLWLGLFHQNYLFGRIFALWDGFIANISLRRKYRQDVKICRYVPVPASVPERPKLVFMIRFPDNFGIPNWCAPLRKSLIFTAAMADAQRMIKMMPAPNRKND